VAIIEVLVWVNAWTLLANLWPRRVSLGPISARTDGGQLLNILTGKAKAALYHLNYFLVESQYALIDHDFAWAAAVCRKGQDLYPDNPYLENNLAVANLELGDFSSAAAVFERQLEILDTRRTEEAIGVTDETREGLRALLLNNLAMALLLNDGEPGKGQVVVDYAQQAYCILPWHHAIESTWGSALVEYGRPELGLAYLEAAHSAHETDRERAGTLAYIAWAHHLLRHEKESAEAMQRALALNVQHYLVQRAQAMIEAAAAPARDLVQQDK